MENGQKTGYFLDQKANRVLLRNMATDKKVLDCFSHTGGFALNAAYGHALKSSSSRCFSNCTRSGYANALLNHLEDRIEFVKADVFDYLDQCPKGKFDIIVLVPLLLQNQEEELFTKHITVTNVSICKL